MLLYDLQVVPYTVLIRNLVPIGQRKEIRVVQHINLLPIWPLNITLSRDVWE